MIVVAIDGPAGAGKSTIAKQLAAKLGISYLDTGAMYRAVTFAALSQGLDLADETAVAKLASSCTMELESDKVTINSMDATTAIRGPQVTAAVSLVALNSAVRTELRQRQRKWIVDHDGGVVEGRDIGSVVFPEATLKVYLTATPLVRAKRRVAQSGGDVDQISKEIAQRDTRDSSRTDSPLVQTSDALTIDTSEHSIDEVVSQIIDLVKSAQREKST